MKITVFDGNAEYDFESSDFPVIPAIGDAIFLECSVCKEKHAFEIDQRDFDPGESVWLGGDYREEVDSPNGRACVENQKGVRYFATAELD